MTQQEINIAIEEELGFTIAYGEACVIEPDRKTGEPNIVDHRPLRDYYNDLNAMREAEHVLTAETQEEYMRILQELTFSRDGDWGFCHATAAQRAEAFLRTLGKWENKP
jgi:hypothetical protein